MTTVVAGPPGRHATAGIAVERASRILLACQDADGSWPDPASAAVSLAAEALLACEFLGIRTAAQTDAAGAHLRARQRSDGSWAGGVPGETADLSASVLAYLALRLSGESPDAYHMAAAAGWIRDAGGLEAVDLTSGAWLAMFGVTEWDSLPVPSLDRLWRPGGSHATTRVAAATVAILRTFQPVHTLPVALTELRASSGRSACAQSVRRSGPAAALGSVRSAVRPGSVRRWVTWLADWQCQPAQSGWARPVMPSTLVALRVAGHPVRPCAQETNLGWLDSLSGQPASASRPCVPPVAQTALAVAALRTAGLRADHPALTHAGRWLLRHRTEGSRVRPGLAPSGWSFCPDGYPRPGDVAVVLVALSGIELPSPAGAQALSSAARWLAGSQDRDGSFGGSAALTASCVRALAVHGSGDAELGRAIRRGVVWLLRGQLPLGGWPARHGGDDLLATCAVLQALLAAGVLPGKQPVTRAIDWLVRHQNADGGWHAGDVTSRLLTGRSDETGTACALGALLAVGGKDIADAADASAGWLMRAQLPDGSWPDPTEQGAAQHRLAVRDPARRSVARGVPLPLAALGQYLAAQSGGRA